MAGYIRQDTANEISPLSEIKAAPLDNEFDAIQSAFSANSGHKHDGTLGGGARITSIGPTGQITVTTSTVSPNANNTISLGTPAIKFKDLHLQGEARAGSLTLTSALALTSGGTGANNAADARVNLGVPSLTEAVLVTGDQSIGGKKKFTKSVEIFGDDGNFLRYSRPSDDRDIIFRGDDNDFYIMISDTPGGSYNSLRPFRIGKSSGLVVMANGLTVSNGISGNLTGNVTGNVSGNAGTASKLATARTLTFTGGATGSGTFDGSGNVSIAMTVPPGSHTHPNATTSSNGMMSSGDKSKLDGISAGAQVNPGVATTSANGLMSSGDKSKLNGIATGAQVNRAISSQAQAESGTDNSTVMTPLRVEQHMLANDLGWGQTWNNMTSQRAENTLYRNETGKPIFVTATCDGRIGFLEVSNGTSSSVMVAASGFNGTPTQDTNARTTRSVVVPNLHYYRFNSGGQTIRVWSELR